VTELTPQQEEEEQSLIENKSIVIDVSTTDTESTQKDEEDLTHYCKKCNIVQVRASNFSRIQF
jgi:hypothetical protein